MSAKKKKNKLDAEWLRICSAITNDKVRISVPRAFLSTLRLFFHHVSDAMAGDDRPDHGLAMMRQGREYYRDPFCLLYGKLRRVEGKMKDSSRRRAMRLLGRYRELMEEREIQFQEKLKKRSSHGLRPD